MPILAKSPEQLLREWADLSHEDRLEAFLQIPRDQADDFFLDLSTRDQLDLIEQLSPGSRRLWVRLLEPDDAADLIQLAPEEMRLEIVGMLDDTARREVSALLAYKEDVAGGLMSPRFARVRPDSSVDEAIAYLRLQAGNVETIYYAYVLDSEQHLLGVVSFRDLFTCERRCVVREIMLTDYVSVREDMDQESVARVFAEQPLLAIPVLDAERRMKGIVTVDDIVDVVTEEASEDIQKIGGMAALDAPYMEIGFWSMIGKRGGWLAILFVGEMLTATAMSRYEDEISRAVVLAVFVPLIISSGGNSGSQASTLMVRAMAVGEVRLKDWWRVARREIPTGLVLGILLASIGALRIAVWQTIGHTYGDHAYVIGLTVALSLVGVVLWGTLSGSMLPFLLRLVGFDPASASAPFVATLVDVIGLVIYFSIASVVLRGTLL
jgi:magnesium transporter